MRPSLLSTQQPCVLVWAASPPGGKDKVRERAWGNHGEAGSLTSFPHSRFFTLCHTSGGTQGWIQGSPKAVTPGPTWVLISLALRVCWPWEEAQAACKVASPGLSRSGSKHELALGGLPFLLLKGLWGEQDWIL